MKFLPSCLLLALSLAGAAEPPVIPVGLDAYRQWDRWAYQRIGVRAYLRSTYDRSGGNERADASHYLYQLGGEEERSVTLDVAGPGILYFARYNHWHGSPWHYEVDGRDHVVAETMTAHPTERVDRATFLPEALFPAPLAWTWTTTHGADLMWVPIPFTQSFRMSYGRTHYGTGYYIYHQFAGSAPLSQPLRAWDGQTPPARDVLDLINRAGTDLVPAVDSAEGKKLGLAEKRGETALPAHATVALTELAGAPAMVRALEFSVPRTDAIAFGRCRLRITWDDSPHASVEAPVALFFGAGTLYNRDEREYLVKAFPVHIRYTADRVHLACFFPMPFARRARFELHNSAPAALHEVRWSLRTASLADPMQQLGYFHATYRDHADATPGHDLVLLDTREAEGGGDWSGSLVGTSWIFSHRGELKTLEGDPRFFFDDSLTPQAQGTGTEEWGGGGDYWGGRNMTLPFAGHPCGARRAAEAKDPEDLIQSAYRFLLADLMPFGRNALIRLEHGGDNRSTEHYETVTYWYGRGSPSLVKTDEFKPGDPASEAAHAYVSPAASPPYEIESRYEWGPDSLDGVELYPAHRDTGRKTTGTSEFTVLLAADNLGVLLRRKLDYHFPNQRVRVFVAPVRAGVVGEFTAAGDWLTAGASTWVFSYPKKELGPAEHNVRTSNRRFRDDEFLLPRALTAGHDALRVRLCFAPVETPLFPGHPPAELAWTEFRYDVYSFVLPAE